jgi:chaperone modulatory protein CbpM
MQATISLSRVCDYLRVDIALVREFAEFGLYQTVPAEGELGIEARELARVEEIMSLHQALGINKEGIDVILELRERVSGLQDEVERLRREVDRLGRRAGKDEPDALRILGLLIEVAE